MLTPEQIDRFNRDGYLMPFRIYTRREVADLRTYFDGLLAQVHRGGEGQLLDQFGPPAARLGCGTC